MLKKWIKEHSSTKKPITEQLNKKGDWAIRRNEKVESDGSYEYEMKIVKTQEKDAYETGMDGARVPIEEVGKSLDNNDTTLMGAIADTYEESSQNSVIMEALADIYEAIISKE
jgi:hypothetical protein